MTTELTYLLLTAILTGLLWIPYIIGLVQTRGFLQPEDYVTLPDGPVPDWVKRANRAHLNALENFSIFAAVVLIAHITDANSGVTATGAAIYFWARVAHAAVFIGGVKHFMARTLIFTIAWAAWLVMAISLLL